MSKKTETKKPANSQNNQQEASAGPTHCRFTACKGKIDKFGFCQNHYEMYMSGVIRGDGTKPVDFEKKFEQFLARKKVA